MSAIDSVLLNKIRVGGNTPTQVRVGGEAIKCVYANSELVYDTCKERNITKTLTGSVTYPTASSTAYSVSPNSIQFSQKVSDKGYSGKTYNEVSYNQNNETLDGEYWEITDHCGHNWLQISNGDGTVSGLQSITQTGNTILVCKVRCTIELNDEEYPIEDIPVYMGGGYVPPTPDPDPDPDPDPTPDPTPTIDHYKLKLTRTIVYDKNRAMNVTDSPTSLNGDHKYRIDLQYDYVAVYTDNSEQTIESNVGRNCSGYGGFTSCGSNGNYFAINVDSNPETSSRSCVVTISYANATTRFDVGQNGKTPEPDPVEEVFTNGRLRLSSPQVYDETTRQYVSISPTSLKYDHAYRLEYTANVCADSNINGSNITIDQVAAPKCYLDDKPNWVSYDRNSSYFIISVPANSDYSPRSATITVKCESDAGTVSNTISVGQQAAPEPDPDPTYSDYRLVVRNVSDCSGLNGDTDKQNIILFVKCEAKNSLTNSYEIIASNVSVTSSDYTYWCRFIGNNTIEVDKNETTVSRRWSFDLSATVDGHSVSCSITVSQNAGTPTPDPDPDPDPTDIWELDVDYAEVVTAMGALGVKRGLVLRAPAGTYRVVYATVDADGVPPIDIGTDVIVTLTASTEFAVAQNYEVYESYGAALTPLYDVSKNDPYDWGSLDYEIDAMKK